MKELKCRFCGKICGREGTLAIHERACSQNPESKNFGRKKKAIVGQVQESWKQENGLYKCPYCGKEFTKKGIAFHIFSMHTKEGKDFKSSPNYNMRGKRSWNKGLTKETSEIIKQCSEKIKQKYASGELVASFKGRHHTEDFKKKARELAYKNHLGGVRKSKRIIYNNQILGSTYELKVAQDLDKNNIKWQTCKRFWYKDSAGIKHSYTPDFYLPDYDIYLDPKNDFLINNVNPRLGYTDIQKIDWVKSQNNIQIIILDKNSLTWEKIKEKLDNL